jgi:hypothetical protein
MTHANTIERALATLQALQLPDTPTDLQIQHYRAQVEMQSVLIGGLRALAAVQSAAPGPDPLSVLVHIKASSPDATPAQMAAQYADIMAAAALVAAPVPALPVPAGAPHELSDMQAADLLAIMAPEMRRYGVQPTVTETQRIWREYWRKEGRRWARDTPGWGPEEDAPDRPAVLAAWA